MKWKTVKTVLLSAIGGAIVWWIVLTAAWGWMSPGSAEKLASERAETAVLEALTPICVANFQQDTEWAASSWSRDDYVLKQGWTTMPGSDEPEQRIAAACVSRILELETTS
jgi:hypothetical protein